jgi:hypothetical protein
MADRERDPELEALARATDGIRPGDGFTEAVMSEVDPLARAALGTNGIRPAEAFTDAMVEAATASGARAQSRFYRVGWAEGVLRSGRAAVALAAAVAAASVIVSTLQDRDLDSDVLASTDFVEVAE